MKNASLFMTLLHSGIPVHLFIRTVLPIQKDYISRWYSLMFFSLGMRRC